MNRRELLGGGMALLAFPGLGAAQAKVSTIGLLWNDSVKPSPYVAILSEALRTKGYVLGRNLRFEDAVALEIRAPVGPYDPHADMGMPQGEAGKPRCNPLGSERRHGTDLQRRRIEVRNF